MRGFQIYGDCMLPTIPVILDNILSYMYISISQYKAPGLDLVKYQFLLGFQATSNPRKIYVHVTGYLV